LSRKFLMLIAAMLTLLLLISGCGAFKKQTTDDIEDIPTVNEDTDDVLTRETLVYYQDDAGYLVPVMRKIPWVEGIAKATLKIMMDTPEQQDDLMAMGLRALLPADAEILGMSIKDGIAKVDFNSAVLNCKDAIAESNMIQGLVAKLAGFSTIEKVQFLFDGKVLETMPFGTYVKDPLGPEDINLEMSGDSDVQGAKVTVFFQSVSPSQYEYLIPITRITSSPVVTLETAIEELLAGPKEVTNMNIDIPQGTKLLGILMDEGITYINFSKEFSALTQSDESERMVFKAIQMTARQFPEVNEVKILVDGREYPGDISMDTPVFANEF
jgi:germination protein M